MFDRNHQSQDAYSFQNKFHGCKRAITSDFGESRIALQNSSALNYCKLPNARIRYIFRSRRWIVRASIPADEIVEAEKRIRAKKKKLRS